jgi:hypothetical protein
MTMTTRACVLAAVAAIAACRKAPATTPSDGGAADASDPYAGWDPSTLHINAIAPDPLVRGAPATITGTGFITDPSRIIVRFGDSFVHPDSATKTSLGATVPRNLPYSSTLVMVLISTYQSNGVPIAVADTLDDGADAGAPGADAGQQGSDGGSSFYLSYVDPSSGAAGATVRLWGGGFTRTMDVYFGGVHAFTSGPLPTYVDAQVPSGLAPGSVDVYASQGGVQSNHVTFTAK